MIHNTGTQAPLETIQLDNGLELQLIDASRKLIGDRWRVRFVARISVPVSTDNLPADQLPEPIEAIRAMLGDPIIYEYVGERNFVDASDKDDILAQERSSFMENAFIYLNRSDFPVRFVLSRYRSKAEEKSWRTEY